MRHFLSSCDLKQALHYTPETGIFIRIGHSAGRAILGEAAGFVDDTTGYRRIGVKGKQYYAHRLAWLYMTGEWPKEQIDHRDLDKDNNRWDNLREATHLQNNFNHGLRKDNESRLKGVRLQKQCKSQRWAARIRIQKVEYHLGLFNCPAAAHFIYLVAADKAHGEFARAG